MTVFVPRSSFQVVTRTFQFVQIVIRVAISAHHVLTQNTCWLKSWLWSVYNFLFCWQFFFNTLFLLFIFSFFEAKHFSIFVIFGLSSVNATFLFKCFAVCFLFFVSLVTNFALILFLLSHQLPVEVTSPIQRELCCPQTTLIITPEVRVVSMTSSSLETSVRTARIFF